MPERLEDLLARQHGVLTWEQALACGLTRSALAARVRGGRWRRLLGRVYATFTGPPPRKAWLWAVVLRAGAGAALSHETAAELVGLVSEPGPAVHVSVPYDRRIARIPGVVVHRSGRLPDAIHPARLPPQTRVEETVLDLVDRAADHDTALGWVIRACAGRHTVPGRLQQAMARRPRLRCRAALVAALADVADGVHSVLELRYARQVERPHGLPAGVRQAVRARRGGRWYDDVHYPAYRTRVELDGQAAHPAAQRRRERRRDNAAVVDGDAVLRYGWDDVTGAACVSAAQVAVVLRRHGWTGCLRACRPGCPAPAWFGSAAARFGSAAGSRLPNG